MVNHPAVTRMAAAAAALSLFASPVSAGGTWRPTPGGFVSGPVQYVKTVPIDAGGAVGATLRDGYLYVTTWRSFSIYDVSDPFNPVLMSTTPSAAHVYNEQPDTNGQILLLTRDVPSPALEIWDVSDKRFPTMLSRVALPTRDHMWTCVRDCAFAYGGRGTIMDLADPGSPRIVGDWTTGLVVGEFHAIEEVAPGLVLTGTVPVYFLDARRDPARPRVLATATPNGTASSYIPLAPERQAPPAFLDWPLHAKDRYVLVSMETPFSGPCNSNSGSFETYDGRGWRRTRTLRRVDGYRMTRPSGAYSDGQAPHNVVGCSAYAFDVPPDYARRRRVAVAWFEHGMRLLRIDNRGRIEELGGFVPFAGNTSGAIWINEEALYLIDLDRGIDILRAEP